MNGLVRRNTGDVKYVEVTRVSLIVFSPILQGSPEVLLEANEARFETFTSHR
jgi:hypothetical protein